jgi:hypothetical protein
MPMSLQISMEQSFPAEPVTETFVMFTKCGARKTYTAAVFKLLQAHAGRPPQTHHAARAGPGGDHVCRFLPPVGGANGGLGAGHLGGKSPARSGAADAQHANH